MNAFYKKAMKVIALPFTLGWMGMVMWLGAKMLGLFEVVVLTPLGEQVVDAWPWMTATLAIMLVLCGAGIACSERK